MKLICPKIIICSLLLLLSSYSFAQDTIWNHLLQKNVNAEGWVNYDTFKKDQYLLNQYLSYLNNTTPNKKWSNNKAKAFWVNAYNAYTIQLILNNYPLKSILDIKQNDKNAWEIPLAKVGSKTYTLNFIEHEILRKTFNDPRIHVAINCASISCPALPNIAFSEKNIETLLNTGIKKFINNPKRNLISKENIKISQIFNWFKDDFIQSGDLITFINQYSDTKISKDANVDFKTYNWNLNKQ